MQIITDVKLDFDSVMLRPMTSSLNSRSEVNLERTFKFYHSPKTWTGVPIIAANMDTVGTLEMAKVLQTHKMITALHKFITVEQIAQQISLGHLNPKFLAFSTGIRPQDFTRLEQFGKTVSGPTWSSVNLSKEIDIIMVDVPNGYIKSFIDGCKRIRQMFPEHIIMAGNIVTPDIAETLIQYAGVDVVKVGIGPGEACTTRALTGVGYPQLSAVMETANAAHGLQGHIISDGGCRTPGDVAKAFAAGADFVMLGGMLAGHDESGGKIRFKKDFVYKLKTNDSISGEVITEFLFQKGTALEESIFYEKLAIEMSETEKREYLCVEFYGMSSTEAMEKHYGGVASHRAPEGRSILKDYKGPVEKTVLEIMGGVRSSATYIGAKTIKEMHKRATFVRVK